MSEQTNMQNDWLQQEYENVKQSSFEGESLPSLKLEENKITTIQVDFSKPFDKWTDPETGLVKKIIPCTCEGERYNFWLNTRNPLYAEIIKEYLGNDKTQFSIMRIGSNQNTKYTLVKD